MADILANGFPTHTKPHPYGSLPIRYRSAFGKTFINNWLLKGILLYYLWVCIVFYVQPQIPFAQVVWRRANITDREIEKSSPLGSSVPCSTPAIGLPSWVGVKIVVRPSWMNVPARRGTSVDTLHLAWLSSLPEMLLAASSTVRRYLPIPTNLSIPLQQMYQATTTRGRRIQSAAAYVRPVFQYRIIVGFVCLYM